MTSDPVRERRLRLGVAGLGRAFSLMLPTFLADPRIELVAAFDVRPEARERFAADFHARVYDSFDAFAADDAMEAVYIASPHQHHAGQAVALARAGRHLLVEKPMSLSLADCNAMVRAADAAGVWLVVGHCHSFDTPYLETRRLIRSGDFGRVRMIHALNYTDFLYRPRRPEELRTAEGGGAVHSQAAHQVDIVRLLAGSEPVAVKALAGAWDAARPTEGAYSALLSFADDSFASITYSGYGHFDSDAWCGWHGELGRAKDPRAHGGARRRLRALPPGGAEAALKNAGTYGGVDYQPPRADDAPGFHQHFGPVIVSCDRADLRPMPQAIEVYGDDARHRVALPRPAVPRQEVIDELHAAVTRGQPPLHDGRWARRTVEVCLAMLDSARSRREVELAVRRA